MSSPCEGALGFDKDIDNAACAGSKGIQGGLNPWDFLNFYSFYFDRK
jgi:hypothetical protein